MGIVGSPDIFHAKILGLILTLEYARTYLDDLLDISNGSFKDHLEKLKVALTGLSNAGLKKSAHSAPMK